ncbi:hypothetical protein H6G06_11760 [Anabaena sphaerica FACHB-251]|uniref:Uncharacterized protein n=1 Tax=Anabaena sphaerica FACHB-251 TaxID=2692883 RepID=A0A926WGN9_9NOST|nr:hypothetical protein [Anabaena sphaerica]MBD2294147.1 hypothetical protein [Anabaena sphaerica FACHB-251]
MASQAVAVASQAVAVVSQAVAVAVASQGAVASQVVTHNVTPITSVAVVPFMATVPKLAPSTD